MEELSSVSAATSTLAFSFRFSGAVSFSVLLFEAKSNACPLPGVLGVFDPKDAKAPDPRPKAEEAAEGEFVEGVDRVLKMMRADSPGPRIR